MNSPPPVTCTKMNTLTLNRYSFCLLTMLISLSAFGQNEITGKFIRPDYPAGQLVLNADGSFKFRFRFDLQWDLACGQFEVKCDTLYFTYTSDMFDVTCNSERINVTDSSDYFLRHGVDKRWRPITARIVRNRIVTIKTGDIGDAETVSLSVHYYRRERKRERVRPPGTYIRQF